MYKKEYQKAFGYWTIGLQYLHLVQAVIAKTIEHRNVHVITSKKDITWDQYDQATKWSDHRLVIPVLFDFYHGIEVILKGFLVAASTSPQTTHKLSELVLMFEKHFPTQAISATIKKYIFQDQLPEVLSSFCITSKITIDDYYQALKYPQSTSGDVYNHCQLKYREEEGVKFFEDLLKDIGEVIIEIVALGRSMNCS